MVPWQPWRETNTFHEKNKKEALSKSAHSSLLLLQRNFGDDWGRVAARLRLRVLLTVLGWTIISLIYVVWRLCRSRIKLEPFCGGRVSGSLTLACGLLLWDSAWSYFTKVASVCWWRRLGMFAQSEFACLKDLKLVLLAGCCENDDYVVIYKLQ